MDKYHSSFDVYTDKDAGGNHYAPSGWMGDTQDITFDSSYIINPHSGSSCIKITYSSDFYDVNHYIPSGWYNGSSNMMLDDSWKSNSHSGSNCIKITWDGSGGDDGWKWNGVAWQQPEGNWDGDSGSGYNLSGATKLTFWARTEDPGLKVKFLVGYPDDSSGEVFIDSDGWVELYNEWTAYEIDLSGKDLSDIACGFAFVFNDQNDPDPDGCVFYLDDITYQYEDKNFNIYTDNKNNWAGIYWQYPENNWGDNTGYDLTGATKLTFWARGQKGGEKIEFKVGGVNCPPYYDSGKSYQDTCGSITTGVITLEDTWQQYEIELADQDLSCIIGGFCWVANNNQNPNGCTFFLDDITYDKQQLDKLRFLTSYETTSASDDKYVTNTSFVYDNTLVMLAFMARGNSKDWERAKILGDSFIYCQNHDRYFNDGRLRNAYQSGDIADFLAGEARLPGWWDEQEQKWFEDKEQVGTSTGNMAWVMIALLSYCNEKGDPKYLEAAKNLGEWIYSNCYDSSGAGGYTGGYEGWEPTEENPGGQTKLLWKSTEYNIDVYAAFTILYKATGDSIWQDRALHAKKFVEAMWSDTENHFWTGTLDDGITINKDVIPLDVQCWGLMALGEVDKYGVSITWAENNCLVDSCPEGCGFEGFDFNDDQDGVWFEGTAHMCIAYQIKDEGSKSEDFVEEIRNTQISASNNDGKGIVAACHDGVTTGFTWVYNNRLHIGATAWYIFAEREYNPYWQESTRALYE